MKMKELIERLDTSKAKEFNTDFESFEEEMNLYHHDLQFYGDIGEEEKRKRLTAYCITSWTCTDTKVGIKAHFLDNEFVCISTQSCRKGDVAFEWKSEDSFIKVKKYLIENFGEKDQSNNFSEINLEEDLCLGMQHDYVDHLLDDLSEKENNNVYLDDLVLVEVLVDVTREHVNSLGGFDWALCKNVFIKLGNGTTESVDCNRLKVPWA